MVLLVNALCAARLILNLRFLTSFIGQFTGDNVPINNMKLTAFNAALYSLIFVKGSPTSSLAAADLS